MWLPSQRRLTRLCVHPQAAFYLKLVTLPTLSDIELESIEARNPAIGVTKA